MLPRPRFRIPLWVALAVPVAAYIVRSIARGMDFTPDLPADALVLVALLVVVGVVAWVRADEARHIAEMAESGCEPENTSSPEAQPREPTP